MTAVIRRKRNSFDLTAESGRILGMYTSLMLILLSFFVFMVSRSNFDEAKYVSAARSLQSTFGARPGGRLAIGTDSGLPDVSLGIDESGRISVPDMEIAQIRAVLAPALLDRQASIIHSTNRRIISLSANLVFNADETGLTEEMAETLTVFSRIMADNNVPIAVTGHTDIMPPQTRGVGDNWDISTRRAMTVVEFLADSGRIDPVRLSAFGYAGTKPLHSNATPQGRARNNRIDLMLDFSEVNAQNLKNMVEKAVTYNFKGFDFLLRDSREQQP